MHNPQAGLLSSKGGCGCRGSVSPQMQGPQQQMQWQVQPQWQQQPQWQTQPSAADSAMQSINSMIIDAVRDEQHDEVFYRQLADLAPNQEERALILEVSRQEHNHNQLLHDVYRQLTGRDLPPQPQPQVQRPESYLDGLSKAIFGEMNGVEHYRQLYTSLPAGSAYRDVVFGIMTNEANHQTVFLYLLTINK